MRRSKIEWCDHTWNPVTGCRNECSYCHARKTTTRFAGNIRLNKMAKKDYSLVPAADGGEDLYELDVPMLNETGKVLLYPFGFGPTLYRYRMNYPEKLKRGKNIFVGAMADVFGNWVPDDWIADIFNICQKYPIHNYLFLTKNPERYERMDSAGFLPIGENLWYGSKLTRPEDKCFVSNAHNTFWNIDPIHAPFQIWEKDGFSPDWIILGAETGVRKDRIIPEKEWIEDIVNRCDKEGIPVFMTESLIPIVGEENMRRNFPKRLQYSEISPKMKEQLFGTCVECKISMRKSSMITLLAKSKRGEAPKQFGFMCKDCFKKFCKKLDLDVPKLSGLID